MYNLLHRFCDTISVQDCDLVTVILVCYDIQKLYSTHARFPTCYIFRNLGLRFQSSTSAYLMGYPKDFLIIHTWRARAYNGDLGAELPAGAPGNRSPDGSLGGQAAKPAPKPTRFLCLKQ